TCLGSPKTHQSHNNPSSPHFGRVCATRTQFVGSHGFTVRAPILLSYSDDSGETFSDPTEISGSNPTFCTVPIVPVDAGKCNLDQFSTPTTGPDDTLYVWFENFNTPAANHR